MQVSAKKTSKSESKMDQNSNTGPAPKRAIKHLWSVDKHFPSADWHKFEPRPEGTWIEIKHILLYFLEIRTRPSSCLDHLAIHLNILASINRGAFSKFNKLFHAF